LFADKLHLLAFQRVFRHSKSRLWWWTSGFKMK